MRKCVSTAAARGLSGWIVAMCLVSAPARADGLLTPFIGYDFSGNAGDCPSVPNCSSKQVSYGVGIGFMVGGLVGFEGEFADAPHFFGDATERGNNRVQTVMANGLLGIPLGPVRPYAVGGVGLLHTDVSRSTIGLYNAFTNNSVAIDVGGGIMAFVSGHVGIRGDLRYIRSLQETTFTQFELNNAKMEFWRGSVGLTLRF